jgi:hypothetical protein
MVILWTYDREAFVYNTGPTGLILWTDELAELTAVLHKRKVLGKERKDWDYVKRI